MLSPNHVTDLWSKKNHNWTFTAHSNLGGNEKVSHDSIPGETGWWVGDSWFWYSSSPIPSCSRGMAYDNSCKVVMAKLWPSQTSSKYLKLLSSKIKVIIFWHKLILPLSSLSYTQTHTQCQHSNDKFEIWKSFFVPLSLTLYTPSLSYIFVFLFPLSLS